MGSCVGRIETEEEDKRIKLMLLGGPAVGKSTIFKQINMLYVKGFDDQYRLECRRLVFITTLLSYRVVVELCERCDKDVSEQQEALQYIQQKVEEYNKTETMEGIEYLDQCILALHGYPAFQEVIELLEEGTDERVRNIETPESGLYFISRTYDMSVPGYLPTDADILRLRRVTNKSEPLDFVVPMEWPPNSREMQNIDVRCMDVGGQQHHEYDWVNHGRDCDAILFVCALSQFYEKNESNKNALRGQLAMLRKVVEAEPFQNKQIVLLINKSDLLESVLKRHKFSDYFKSYKGDNSPNDVFNYFRASCMEVLQREDRDMSIVRTCALDTQLMQKILSKVLLALFRSILKETWAG